jgi:phage gp36-like protein
MDIMGFIKSDTKIKEGLVDACQIVDGYLRYKLL